MITQIKITNFGPLPDIDWKLGQINLVIGGNGAGKTMLLKAMYAAIKTVEEYQRGDSPKSVEEILAEKLIWTFQADKLGDLVRHGEKQLQFHLDLPKNQRKAQSLSFGLSSVAQTKLSECQPLHLKPREDNSIFLPAKEVLSLHKVILKSRDTDKAFGFDDTYYDLAKVLQSHPTMGKNYKGFAQSREKLEAITGGVVRHDDKTGRWYFQQGKNKYAIGATAEGIKKIAILDNLLGNRYLSKDSIVFIDEAESALHPRAISQLMEIIAALAAEGLQFVISTHSYFVIKKLLLIALEKKISIPTLSFWDGGVLPADLKDGMPDNPIIDESIKLYEQEVELAFK